MAYDRRHNARRQPLRVIRLIAGALLLCTFMAAHAARFVPPERLWFLQLLAPVTPWLGIGVLGLILVAALRGEWVVACVYALSWSTLTFLPALSIECLPSLSGVTYSLTVITFNANTQFAGAKDDSMRALLQEEKPHIVALQEVPLGRVPETGGTLGVPLVQPLLEGQAFQPAWPLSPERAVLVQPTFSRLPARGSLEEVFTRSTTGLWRSGGVNRMVYEWEGRDIAIYNVHLHSFSGNRPWQHEEGQRRRIFSWTAWKTALGSYREDFATRALQARALKDVLDAEPLPFLVCGDLNSTPYNWVYAHLSHGLWDVFKEAGSGWGATFHAQFPVIRIDFVLASKEWAVLGAHVNKTIVSDHIPVVAKLVLRHPPETDITEER